MHSVYFTSAQKQRLVELNYAGTEPESGFETPEARDAAYRRLSAELVKKNRELLAKALYHGEKSTVALVAERLESWLGEMGFAEVSTPHIITAQCLDKMSITESHPLRKQVFWLDGGRCLRPMLAPGLYTLMRDLHKALNKPVRIYEIGTCFRKEQRGAGHLNEFIMLNLVEYASVKQGEQQNRLRELASLAMSAAGVEGTEIIAETSDVYGETLDIIRQGTELASGATGPHALDAAWGVFETWVGLGIGIERVAMAVSGHSGVGRLGRSTAYLNGARIN
ncbi:MAG: pyrrolysine--tRNA(Pyl) ligase large subunit [Defluviitaleaceae bacterium]|nr:pyrrolysine--tRNA(Pyl) ligase large subunit [Defluviitaleaceae bacterium]MCL2836625.1 pyrrolysine--tRNA(Pyl) ligase large subunit [Defluviitaleaceae bacterium]